MQTSFPFDGFQSRAKATARKPWCSKHEIVSLPTTVFGVVVSAVKMAAADFASLLGIPWERVKKRRQRGWSWTEALNPALRARYCPFFKGRAE